MDEDTVQVNRKGRLEQEVSLKPDSGKPTVRNFRGGAGNNSKEEILRHCQPKGAETA
jgi:hypothetical protein